MLCHREAPQAEKDLAALRLAQAQELLSLATATKAAAVQVKSAAEENVLAAVALEAGNSVEGRAKATAAAALAENAVGSSEAVVGGNHCCAECSARALR